MKYKVGDKVRIKSLDWYNNNKNNKGVIVCGSESFTHPMSYFCNKVVNIITIQDDCYRILEDDGDWYWTDEMIEGLVEEEIKNWADTSIPDGPYTVTYDSPAMNDFMSKNNIHNEIILPDGYIFKDENGNVINAMKIVLEKKKKEYPKTYKECCEVIEDFITIGDYWGYKHDLFVNFQKLILCRDAYWKIAGDEMGLGKPWEQCDSKVCYGIITVAGEIQHDTIAKWRILTVPTAEMRDAFYENFKEEIEICKELL